MNFKLLRTLKGVVILSLLFCASSYAQVRKITGKVTDANDGGPLPGVNVSIKGKPSNVSTNEDGIYTIQANPETDALVFSYIGFTRQTVNPAGKTTLNVQLVPNNEALKEVEIVSIGYGSQKKISSTHAIENVNMKAIEDLPVGSLAAALRGQLAAVSVNGGQSRPGQNATITIRQPRIFSKDGGNTEPIYIVDDVFKTPAEFNLLDQSEIESISVLKDAAAAIYGVNGNQGAVLVKTKRGKIGAPKISYSGSVGITDATRLPKMMSGYDQARYLNTYNYTEGKFKNPAFDWNGALVRYTDEELNYFKNYNYDWLDMAWKASTINRHTLNVTGGADKATYFASVTYNAQDANLDNINSDRWTYRASTDIKLATGLNLGVQLSGDVYNNKSYWLKQGGENVEKDVLALMQTPQFIPPYINGYPVNITGSTSATTENFHFFAVQNNGDYTKTRNVGLNVNLNLNYEIPFIKGLSAKATYNQRNNNSFGKQYGTAYDVYNFSMLGNKHIYGGNITSKTTLKNGYMLRFNPTYDKNYQINGGFNFNRSFGKHNISAMALVEQRESYADGVATYIEDPIMGGEDNMNYFYGTSVMQSESESEAGYLSYISRFSYNYDEKYLFETTVRADASTNFAPENRWGYFPSFSAGWIVSKENFFKKNVNFVNFLKIRATLGFAGSDRTRGFQWYDRYRKQTQRSAVFGGDADRTLVFNQNGISNRNVLWDDAVKMGIGIETRFLRDRLSVTIDGYKDKFKNMLTQLTSSVSLLVGEALPSENYSRVNTFGTEVSVGWNDRIGKDWSYRVNTFLSWYDDKNILKDVSAGNKGTMMDPNGRSSDQGVYGYKYGGLFRTQEEVDAFMAINPNYRLFGEIPKPGMIWYQDVSGPRNGSGDLTAPDGVITADDQTYLTKKADNHYGLGFNFNVTYKSLSLGITSGMSWGGQAVVEGDARARATTTLNKPAFWADHWTEETPNAKYPNPFYTQTYTGVSEFWFRSSTTVRITNLNLSYTLPQNISKSIGISSLRAFVVATNPFELYNPFKDYKTNSGSFNVYPVLKTWSLGLNVGF
ncbi:MAG: SusC/RagA family TonB-linked outer membrane protein [Candidatus Pedobacter colombiensis]|uniref:SusC/RagA family TonB-linked outer membrane protein n=1 Tax=Candidatus Pedobacter colombiensis TaxID=3121371 RepID=A0AAJ5W665_9SPHI|nr:SusC/RagA family TonB-linked outer membrane protein [Pedobacter sp.]WEK17714.1 MAG: SusC/RagA family TonB-linked outer membrane protein [Pedobacter sp.]